MLDKGQQTRAGVLLRDPHGLLCQPERYVGAATVAERAGCRIVVGDDTADENDVIARVDDVVHVAVEPCDDPIDDRAAGGARGPVDGGEPIFGSRAEDR